jgi:hypothetical protein
VLSLPHARAALAVRLNLLLAVVAAATANPKIHHFSPALNLHPSIHPSLSLFFFLSRSLSLWLSPLLLQSALAKAKCDRKDLEREESHKRRRTERIELTKEEGRKEESYERPHRKY